MFRYNLKLAFRSLNNDKSNTAINLFGLAVGMASVILIFLYVQFELSYDKSHSKHDRVYSVVSQFGRDQLKDMPICIRVDNNIVKAKYPEVEELTQLYSGWYPNIVSGENRFNKFKLNYVDSNFYKVFDLNFVSGDCQTAFKSPKNVVLSETTAKAIFGNKEALNETLIINGKQRMVSGVVKRFPSNSHINFDLLLPMTAIYKIEQMTGLEFLTYVLFKDNVDTDAAADKVITYYGNKLKELAKKFGFKTGSYMLKLTDIHLYSKGEYFQNSGDVKTVVVYIVLAILILLIAIINFVNIMITKYDEKMIEIGLKKAIGASKRSIMGQYLSMSLVLSFSAVVLALIFVELMLPFFNDIVNSQLVLSYSSNIALLASVPLLALFIGLIAGVYPAVYLSLYSPSSIIRGTVGGRGKSGRLTKILVVSQFIISMFLISSHLIMHRQIDYWEKIDLGWKPEKVIEVSSINRKLRRSYPSIKEALMKNPLILSVSASDHHPGGGASGQGFCFVGQNQNEGWSFNEYRVKADYFKTLGIEIVEGRAFMETNISDKNTIIINQAGVKSLGVDNVVGRDVMYHGRVHKIIGVAKDFNYESLHSTVKPLMFTFRSHGLGTIIINYGQRNLKEVKSYIQTTLKEFDPGCKIEFILTESRCRNRYQKEKRHRSLINTFSVLSLVLALLGLYALTIFMVQRRTKEIGIRKVSGATVFEISTLLLKTYIVWIAIAFLVATPLTVYVMNMWLEQFAYRVDVGFVPIVLSLLVTSFVVLLTVGYNTWRAANQNPVKSLRYE